MLATLADVDYDVLDAYGATMGHRAESMAYGELGRPDLAVAKDSDRVLRATDQGGYLRQPLTEFLTFALSSAGRIGEAVEVAERHVRSQRGEPTPARAVASQILGMVMLAAGDLDTALAHLPGGASTEAADSFHVVKQLLSVPPAACAGTGPVR